ncbi:MAG TPA: SseB family protein [Candidatus Hungatella pullicola]|nr:SseB family protein [Candidatus Hungatella pullicola]
MKSNSQSERQALLQKLRTAPQLFTLVSVCTKEPYLTCDPETFDDEVRLFFQPEEAKAQAKKLLDEKVPVTVAKMENQQMLMFYTNLYTMGANALRVLDDGMETVFQLQDIVRKREPDQLPEGTVWVENPQLHLTSLYYAQELRRQEKTENNSQLREYQEEISVNYRKGKYILAVQKEDKGTPLVKLTDENMYQPVFTDILEFNKFNKENKFTPIVLSADKIAQLLPPEAKGVVLNLLGVSLPMALRK